MLLIPLATAIPCAGRRFTIRSDDGTGWAMPRFAAMPSSVIKAAYYRPDEAVLDILFTTGRRYLYHEVPAEEADRFAAAFSKGRYFNAHIRDRYDFTEIASAPT